MHRKTTLSGISTHFGELNILITVGVMCDVVRETLTPSARALLVLFSDLSVKKLENN